MLVDALGELFQTLRALFQSALRLLLRGRDEDVPPAQVPEPPPQSIEVLLLLVELRGGELLGRDLLLELPIELDAFAEELLPLLLSLSSEEVLQPSVGVVSSWLRIEHQRLATRSLNQGNGARYRADEVFPGGHRPCGLVQG